jgi:hypothetical protein
MNGMVQKLEEQLLILQDWQQPNQSSVVKRSLTVKTKSHNYSTIRGYRASSRWLLPID